jgi:hypothetical protein
VIVPYDLPARLADADADAAGGQPAFRRGLAAGRSLTLDEAAAAALNPAAEPTA